MQWINAVKRLFKTHEIVTGKCNPLYIYHVFCFDTHIYNIESRSNTITTNQITRFIIWCVNAVHTLCFVRCYMNRWRDNEQPKREKKITFTAVHIEREARANRESKARNAIRIGITVPYLKQTQSTYIFAVDSESFALSHRNDESKIDKMIVVCMRKQDKVIKIE